MRAVLVLLIVACAMSVAYGDLVCGLKYCNDHPCAAPVAKTSCPSNSEYRAQHAGLCGCCPACVTFLNENQACKTYSKELGETPSAVCQNNLICLKGVCTSVKPRH